MEIYQKTDLIFKGWYKEVYSISNHPDKVMKIGETVIKEAEKFQRYPYLCPIVYYVDKKKKFSVVEKLNTDKAKSIFNNFIPKTLKLQHNDLYFDKSYELLKKQVDPDGVIFLDRVREIVKELNMSDITPNNFGFDSNDVLKCLDL